MKYIFTILSVFTFWNFAIYAQTTQSNQGQQSYTLTGSITDNNGDPLEYATFSVFRLSDSSLLGGELTDLDGRFQMKIDGVPSYGVIEFIGFQTYVLNPIPIDKASANNLIELGTIQMSSGALDLMEVEVRAEKSETQFSLDKRIFNVGQDLANRGGSAIDILDNVPSVTVDIEGGVSLRGSSGVRILINGKRSGLGENLQAIPSNQIDRIEVITNPSSRYDAEGAAGIINIILKKDQSEGFNGSFDLNTGYPLQAGVGTNINYRKNKVNWFAGYGLQYRENEGGGYRLTTLTTDIADDITDQDIDRNRSGLSHTLRFGMDYFFNEKTTLTGSIRYQVSDDENRTTNTYYDYVNNYPENLVRTTVRVDDEDEDEEELEYSLNFRKEFKSPEHTLNISVDYEDEDETELSQFNQEAHPIGLPTSVTIQRSSNRELQKEWVGQADYIHPFSKDNKMEFGVKASFREISTDFKVEDYEGDAWVDAPGLSNNFIYDEDILAAYSQYGNKFGKFSFQLGLRAEYADISTKLLQTGEENDRDRLDWFPSLFLNYEITEFNAFQVSYSRRIRRPRFWDLNPFYTYSDNRNIRSGNPNLNPEYTDSYEINYLKFWDEATLNTGIFYRHSTGVIERIQTIGLDSNFNQITISQPENLSERDDYGLEVAFTYSGIDWLRLDASANFFRSITDGKNLGETYQADTYTWTSRLSSRFTFWKGSDLQLRMNYRAPRETTQGRNKSMTSVDIGWSKDLLPQKNLTVTLGVRDVLNSRKHRYEQHGEDFETNGEFQWRARSFNLSFNYRINQKKKKERSEEDFEGGGEGF